MNIKDQKVSHGVFGNGIITAFDGNYFTVSFSDREMKFVYPDAFLKHLVADDSLVKSSIDEKLKLIAEEKQRRKDEKERKREEEEKQRNKDNVKTRSKKPKLYPRKNIAFKCNFCDGGKTKDLIGFHGVCSDSMIKYNIEKADRIWCSSDECPCKQYNDGDITRSELEQIMSHNDNSGFVCYESSMLRDWRAFAGFIRTGENKGKPMRLLKVQLNSLAVLTTRDPGATDNTRYIFAVFLIDETYEGDNLDAGYVKTQSKFKIQMTPDEAKRLKFWDYYFCQNAPEVIMFGSGLHRYLSDDQAVQILRDIVAIKKGAKDENLAKSFLETFCIKNAIKLEDVPEPNGALRR